MTNEAVTCSSPNIYPVPQVTWTTEPPTDQEVLDNATVKITDHKGLFTVESTLRIVGNLSDYTYFCSFMSADKTQVCTASQKTQGMLGCTLHTAVMTEFEQSHLFLKAIFCHVLSKLVVIDGEMFTVTCSSSFIMCSREYNTRRRPHVVHSLCRPSQSPELLSDLDFHTIL